jgi:uncharacterized membrane protein
MTSLAETGHRVGWRGRLIWVALALSLTLNVFVFGGIAWMHTHAPPPPTVRLQRFGQSLNLNAEQQRAFDQFLRTIRLRGRFARESNQPLIEDMWGEIASPTPDQSTIAKLADQITTNRENFQHEASAALDIFIKTLTPEQRAQLAAKATMPQQDPANRILQMVVP